MNNAITLIPLFATAKNSDEAEVWGADGDRIAIVHGNLGYDVSAIDFANFIVEACNSHNSVKD